MFGDITSAEAEVYELCKRGSSISWLFPISTFLVPPTCHALLSQSSALQIMVCCPSVLLHMVSNPLTTFYQILQQDGSFALLSCLLVSPICPAVTKGGLFVMPSLNVPLLCLDSFCPAPHLMGKSPVFPSHEMFVFPDLLPPQAGVPGGSRLPWPNHP